ncbi:MAG: hypothetical protein OXU30_07585 [Gammaproteobacteria bacterium]|nr:hypothetical protein [Gammaproteobacteria bacterium]
MKLIEMACYQWVLKSEKTDRATRRDTSFRYLNKLADISISLSAEDDLMTLLTKILTEGQNIACCDAAFLYLINDINDHERELVFKLTQNDSLDLPFEEMRFPMDESSVAGAGPNLLENLDPDASFATVASGADLSGNLGGYFTGSATSTGSNGAVALGFELQVTSSAAADSYQHVLYGTVAVNANGAQQVAASTPDATIETQNISWGSWDNPIEDNWVVVNEGSGEQVELQTSGYEANVTPTPVANLQGSASYGTTLASSFIGSGSAGNVTRVIAGLDVDFNNGLISNGNLQVQVAGSQAWDIDFAGMVNNGIVDLNALGGTLSDPGGLISNSIEANLGGVFTGINAEAFVGGFDLIDQLNQFNHVNGIFTIEK